MNLGAGGRNRTRDPLITSQVLYQLSYTGEEMRIMPLRLLADKRFNAFSCAFDEDG